MFSVCSADGQAQRLAGDTALPGGYHNGQYIGFQPKYGQVPPPVPPHLRAAEATQSVAQTNYQTVVDNGTIPGETVIVEGDGEYYGDPGTGYTEYGFGAGPVAPCAKIWGSIEYLGFWTKGTDVQALATTSPIGTSQDEAGVLGLRNTSVLFGDQKFTDSSRDGGRITLGFWLDPMQVRALELTYMNLATDTDRFRASNDDFGILARPFFNTDAGAEDSRLITFPDLVEGNLDIAISTKFQTAEVLVRSPTAKCNGCLDYYFGYRYALLEDRLGFSESTLSLSGPTQDATFLLNESLASENEFHGAQLGVRFSSQSSAYWGMDLTAKIALGNTKSTIMNAGETTVTVPTGESSTQPGGLLVQDSNLGVFESDEFSTITELGATLKRHITCHTSLTFGYTFFLWTDVVRSGDNLDTSVNVTQIPPGTLDGEPRPAVSNETVDFWAHGLRLGLETRF